MNCEQCGGPCWDNRAKNAQRARNGEKLMPQYACKDKDGCGWIKWAPKNEDPTAFRGGSSSGGRSGGSYARKPYVFTPRHTWQELMSTYQKSLVIAVKCVPAAVPKCTSEDIMAGAHALFIAATKGGIKPEPVQQRPPADVEEGYDDAPWHEEGDQ